MTCWIENSFFSRQAADLQIDGLMQERRNSSALAMELRLSCINPSRRWQEMQCWACAILPYLQLVSTGDTAVLHQAIGIISMIHTLRQHSNEEVIWWESGILSSQLTLKQFTRWCGHLLWRNLYLIQTFSCFVRYQGHQLNVLVHFENIFKITVF